MKSMRMSQTLEALLYGTQFRKLLEKELGAVWDGQEKKAPYFTKEGRCIDVADFAVCRKNKA